MRASTICTSRHCHSGTPGWGGKPHLAKPNTSAPIEPCFADLAVCCCHLGSPARRPWERIEVRRWRGSRMPSLSTTVSCPSVLLEQVLTRASAGWGYTRQIGGRPTSPRMTGLRRARLVLDVDWSLSLPVSPAWMDDGQAHLRPCPGKPAALAGAES